MRARRQVAPTVAPYTSQSGRSPSIRRRPCVKAKSGARIGIGPAGRRGGLELECMRDVGEWVSLPGAPMAELIFRCPYSNRPIASGINVDRRDAQRMRFFPIRIRCPHCGFDHDGTVADGELREAA
jgi:hypothetical protein